MSNVFSKSNSLSSAELYSHEMRIWSFKFI